jgi:hypothetical protein
MTAECTRRRARRIEQDGIEQRISLPIHGIRHYAVGRKRRAREIVGQQLHPWGAYIERRHPGTARRKLHRLAARGRAQVQHRIACQRPEQRCRRESCGGRKRPGNGFCSALCALVADALEDTQTSIQRAGTGRVSGQLWVAAVSLNDALTEFRRSQRILDSIIRSGLGDEASITANPLIPAKP